MWTATSSDTRTFRQAWAQQIGLYASTEPNVFFNVQPLVEHMSKTTRIDLFFHWFCQCERRRVLRRRWHVVTSLRCWYVPTESTTRSGTKRANELKPVKNGSGNLMTSWQPHLQPNNAGLEMLNRFRGYCMTRDWSPFFEFCRTCIQSTGTHDSNPQIVTFGANREWISAFIHETRSHRHTCFRNFVSETDVSNTPFSVGSPSAHGDVCFWKQWRRSALACEIVFVSRFTGAGQRRQWENGSGRTPWTSWSTVIYSSSSIFPKREGTRDPFRTVFGTWRPLQWQHGWQDEGRRWRRAEACAVTELPKMTRTHKSQRRWASNFWRRQWGSSSASCTRTKKRFPHFRKERPQLRVLVSHGCDLNTSIFILFCEGSWPQLSCP